MKKTTRQKKQDEYELDDEVLREQAMADGPVMVDGIELRPITAVSISWMQRNNILGDEMDPIWRASAFAFLHAAPREDIRAVVNSRDDFKNAVDDWLEDNIGHHSEVMKFSAAMTKAFELYQASASEVPGGSKGASGN